MRRKKYTALLLCCSMIGGMLNGCGESEKSRNANEVKIGVTVYDQYDTFISQLMEQFNQYAAQTMDAADSDLSIQVEVYNAGKSQTTQNSQVENMIAQGCDVICVNLVDRTEPVTIIDMAEKENIPIIFFNRELVEQDLERWDRLYYVGSPALESGIMQGEMAADLFRKEPSVDKNGDGVFQYVILEGEMDHQDAIVRTEYAVSTIMEKGVEAEKLGYAIANWNRAQAQTKMTQLLSQYGDKIELVLANNDDMALGAVDALKEAEIPQEEWPAIFGIDGTDVGQTALSKGELKGTVYNDKEGQAKAMLSLAMQLARRGTLEDLDLQDGKYIRLPYKKLEKIEGK